MIVCKVCGTQNEVGAQFCGNCGSFLEWSGEAAPDETSTQPKPIPGPDPGPAPRPDPDPAAHPAAAHPERRHLPRVRDAQRARARLLQELRERAGSRWGGRVRRRRGRDATPGTHGVQRWRHPPGGPRRDRRSRGRGRRGRRLPGPSRRHQLGHADAVERRTDDRRLVGPAVIARRVVRAAQRLARALVRAAEPHAGAVAGGVHPRDGHGQAVEQRRHRGVRGGLGRCRDPRHRRQHELRRLVARQVAVRLRPGRRPAHRRRRRLERPDADARGFDRRASRSGRPMAFGSPSPAGAMAVSRSTPSPSRAASSSSSRTTRTTSTTAVRRGRPTASGSRSSRTGAATTTSGS